MDFLTRLNIQRSFDGSLGKGKVMVEHSIFTLHDDLQGKGFSNKVLAFTDRIFRYYGESNFSSIEVEANLEIGGYAWLRRGFLPEDVDSFLRAAREAITGHSDLYVQLKKTVDGFTQKQLLDFVISDDFRRYKDLFLGVDWSGSLDVSNPEALAAFRRNVEPSVFGGKYVGSEFEGQSLLDSSKTIEVETKVVAAAQSGDRQSAVADTRDASRPVASAVLDGYIRHDLELQRMYRTIFNQNFRDELNVLAVELNRFIVEGGIEPDNLGRVREFRVNRVDAIIRNSSKLIDEKYDFFRQELVGDLRSLAEIESGFFAKVVNDGVGVDFTLNTLTATELRYLLDSNLVLGGPAENWWSRQASSYSESFANHVRFGVTRGQTAREIARSALGDEVIGPGRRRAFLGGLAQKSIREAQALVQTAMQSVAQNVRSQTFAANSDVVDAVQFLSVLDGRTTVICMSFSGQVYDLATGNSLQGGGSVQTPPLHFRCRSTLIPVLKSFEDLGIKNKAKVKSVPGKQESFGGLVAENLNYDSWLRTQSVSFQRSTLGDGRFSLWQDGKLPLNKLIDSSTLRPFTLAELRASVL